MTISGLILASAMIQSLPFQLFAIIVIGAILIKNGGDVRKF
jgi:hypothetical protein